MNIEDIPSFKAFVDAPVNMVFQRLAASNKPVFIDAPDTASLETFGLVKMSDMLKADYPTPQWVVEGMIPGGEVSLLVSDGGIGKSWLLLALAETIANNGHTFLGHYCTPGNVVYLDMELDQAWCAARVRMIDAGLLKQGVITQRGGHETFYLESPRITLDGAAKFLDRLPPLPGEPEIEPGAFDYLRNIIRQANASVLILDPIAELWGNIDENAASETSPVLKALRVIARETGAAIVVAHHTNKGRIEERGSTAIRNAAGAMYILTWHIENGMRTRRLECNKLRHAKEPEPLFLDFVWNDGVLTIEQLTYSQTEERAKDEKSAAARMDAQLVVQMVAEKPAKHYNKARLMQMLTESEEMSRRQAEDAIARAEAAGLIVTEDGPRNAKLYRLGD